MRSFSQVFRDLQRGMPNPDRTMVQGGKLVRLRKPRPHWKQLRDFYTALDRDHERALEEDRHRSDGAKG